MGVRAPGGGAPGVQVMAGERGTAGSPAGSNEMIDVKKARVLYRVCATSLAFEENSQNSFHAPSRQTGSALASSRGRARSERYLRAFARSGGALSSRSGSRLGR